MARRSDKRAEAALRDLHVGLHMALVAAEELLNKDLPTDSPGEVDWTPAYKALDKVVTRVVKAARKRVTAQLEDAIPADSYLGPS